MSAPRRAGFTLVEVTVALVIAGIVAAAAYATVRTAVSARDAAARAADGPLRATAVRAALAGWLESASPLPGAPLVLVDRSVGGVPRDELQVGVEDGGALFPGPRRIRLRVERDPARPPTGLLAEVAAPWGPDAGRVDTLPLVPGAAGLDVRLLRRVRGREVWAARWEAGEGIPEGVELRVVPGPEAAAGGDPADALLLRLPLRVAPRPVLPDSGTGGRRGR